jgi:putative endonuclease
VNGQVRRAGAAQAGRDAETAARAWLEQRGLVCLRANFRARVGELDLVMREGEVLVIVEVRQRTHRAWGGAAGSVDAHKQRRIIGATSRLLSVQPAYAARPLRFDVVAVEGAAPEWRFEWIRDAFRPA